MSSAGRPKARRIAGPSARSIVTTLLVVMLAAMIVKDILVRRFGADRHPRPDVTQRSR